MVEIISRREFLKEIGAVAGSLAGGYLASIPPPEERMPPVYPTPNPTSVADPGREVTARGESRFAPEKASPSFIPLWVKEGFPHFGLSLPENEKLFLELTKSFNLDWSVILATMMIESPLGPETSESGARGIIQMKPKTRDSLLAFRVDEGAERIRKKFFSEEIPHDLDNPRHCYFLICLYFIAAEKEKGFKILSDDRYTEAIRLAYYLYHDGLAANTKRPSQNAFIGGKRVIAAVKLLKGELKVIPEDLTNLWGEDVVSVFKSEINGQNTNT